MHVLYADEKPSLKVLGPEVECEEVWGTGAVQLSTQWEMLLFPVITVFYKGKKAIRRQELPFQIGIYNYPFMGDAGML